MSDVKFIGENIDFVRMARIKSEFEFYANKIFGNINCNGFVNSVEILEEIKNINIVGCLAGSYDSNEKKISLVNTDNYSRLSITINHELRHAEFEMNNGSLREMNAYNFINEFYAHYMSLKDIWYLHNELILEILKADMEYFEWGIKELEGNNILTANPDYDKDDIWAEVEEIAKVKVNEAIVNTVSYRLARVYAVYYLKAINDGIISMVENEWKIIRFFNSIDFNRITEFDCEMLEDLSRNI